MVLSKRGVFVLVFAISLFLLLSSASAKQFIFNHVTPDSRGFYSVSLGNLSQDEIQQISKEVEAFREKSAVENASLGLDSYISFKNPYALKGLSLVIDTPIRHTEYIFDVSENLNNSISPYIPIDGYIIELKGTPLVLRQEQAQFELASAKKLASSATLSGSSLSTQDASIKLSTAETKLKAAIAEGQSSLQKEHQDALKEINNKLNPQPQLSPPTNENLIGKLLYYLKFSFIRVFSFTGLVTQTTIPSIELKGEHSILVDAIVVGDLTPDQVDAIRSLPSVVNVYPNRKDVKATLMDSVPLIGADKVWQLDENLNNCTQSGNDCLTGKGIKIAIIDTGVDYTHPDLGGCLGAGCKVIGGWDFVNNDADPMDDMGHGTHVASIAAGNGVLKGVAPDAQILSYKVLDSQGSGSIDTLVKGIEAAIDPNGDGDTSDHADVLSMSLGMSCQGVYGFGALGIYGADCGPDDIMSKAVDRATAAGVVATIAAGNLGDPSIDETEQNIASPGTARSAITVGATDKTDVIAYFSSRGPVIINNPTYYYNQYGIAFINYSSTQPFETITKPDVVAPGVAICAAEWGNAWSTSRCLDGRHVALSGTSMATPHVAGAAALIKQVHPDYTPQQIKDLLMLSAKDLGMIGDAQGAGRLDVYSAINGAFSVRGNLDFSNESLDMGKSYTREITLVNLRDTDTSVSLSAAPILSDTNMSLNVISFSEPNFVMSSYGEKKVQVTLTLPSENLRSSSGFIYATSGGNARQISYKIANKGVLNLTLKGIGDEMHIPDFYIHKNDFSEAYSYPAYASAFRSFGLSVWDKNVGDLHTLYQSMKVPLDPGNYIAYAIEGEQQHSGYNIYHCDNGACSRRQGGYIIYQPFQIKLGHTNNVVLDMGAAKEIDFNPVSPGGMKLNVLQFQQQVVSYLDGVNNCNKYGSLGKSGCENNAEKLQCVWDTSNSQCENKNLFEVNMAYLPYFNSYTYPGVAPDYNAGNFTLIGEDTKTFRVYMSPHSDSPVHTDAFFSYQANEPAPQGNQKGGIIQ